MERIRNEKPDAFPALEKKLRSWYVPAGYTIDQPVIRFACESSITHRARDSVCFAVDENKTPVMVEVVHDRSCLEDNPVQGMKDECQPNLVRIAAMEYESDLLYVWVVRGLKGRL